MSRISLIEQLYAKKKKGALDFNYDALWAPPIRSILFQEDINQLYKIATSLKYNANIERKYELIDSIMKARGFRKAHCGTNRVVYNFLENPTFVAKVALDKVGLKDSPAEYMNQEFFKPFCCKIFEVDPTGVIAFVERVNPISSVEEFLSVSDDIFNLMITKIIGKYVVDDLGSEKFMNYGIRYNANGTTFGPVIIDFPYAYELDGAKLICNKMINTPLGMVPCHGEIDYDDGLNHLICTKCGRSYKATDLKKNTKDILVIKEDGGKIMRTKIMSGDKVIKDSGITSKTHISKELFDDITNASIEAPVGVTKVTKNTKCYYDRSKKSKYAYFNDLQNKAQADIRNAINTTPTEQHTVVKASSAKTINTTEKSNTTVESIVNASYQHTVEKVKINSDIVYSAGRCTSILDEMVTTPSADLSKDTTVPTPYKPEALKINENIVNDNATKNISTSTDTSDKSQDESSDGVIITASDKRTLENDSDNAEKSEDTNTGSISKNKITDNNLIEDASKDDTNDGADDEEDHLDSSEKNDEYIDDEDSKYSYYIPKTRDKIQDKNFNQKKQKRNNDEYNSYKKGMNDY